MSINGDIFTLPTTDGVRVLSVRLEFLALTLTSPVASSESGVGQWQSQNCMKLFCRT